MRCAGGLLSLGLFLGAAELYLRYFPPSDFHDFLGADSPNAGKLSLGGAFRISFATWDDLKQDNPRTLSAGSLLDPANDSLKRPWLLVGSSFAFALAAESQKLFPDHPTVTLDRRESLVVRLAQIKTLLESGSRPERIFLVTIDVDFCSLAEHRLGNYAVSDLGGLVFAPRVPSGPPGALVANSRLALGVWVRMGFHRDVSLRRSRNLHRDVPDSLCQDLEEILAALGRLSAEYPDRLTILHIPAKKSIVRNEPSAFENALVALCGKHGVDLVDPRVLFLSQPDRDALYIPDGHLSDLGNEIVLRELRRRYPPREGSPARPVEGALVSHSKQAP